MYSVKHETYLRDGGNDGYAAKHAPRDVSTEDQSTRIKKKCERLGDHA
jgi:hypothetical protein